MKPLYSYYSKTIFIHVKVEYPLKQGLKQIAILGYYYISHNVKVEYPLKQGLKRYLYLCFFQYSGVVKVEYPLKQGLKQSIR